MLPLAKWFRLREPRSQAKRTRHTRRTPHASQPPRAHLGLEVLEDRLAPAVVQWDGPIGGGNWNLASNWDGNVLPGAGDDVVIGAALPAPRSPRI